MKAVVENYSSSRERKISTRMFVTIFTFLLLLTLGLVNLYSAATPYVFRNQLQHTVCGLIVFILLGWFISLRIANTYSYVGYALVALVLTAVLISGYSAGGAQRWFVLGPIRFQPSELAKMSIAIFIAKYFYNNRLKSYYHLTELWPVLLAVGFYFLLIFVQPDFGTAGMCVLIPLAQLCFVKVAIRFKTIVAMAITGLVSAVLGWEFFLRPYQKLRIINLFNPGQDPSGSGYNSLQSLVAIGSGGHWGKGFLQGTQAQLQFLPARQTDFIFSVFAEERGFWGGVVCFSLFCILSYCALEIAQEAKNTFSTLLAIGISALLFIEFVINVAMVLGIFPVVGMPLPFFSYGGTALITYCGAVGLLIAIERETIKG
jgi:rod shape determining protein RodA